MSKISWTVSYLQFRIQIIVNIRITLSKVNDSMHPQLRSIYTLFENCNLAFSACWLLTWSSDKWTIIGICISLSSCESCFEDFDPEFIVAFTLKINSSDLILKIFQFDKQIIRTFALEIILPNLWELSMEWYGALSRVQVGLTLTEA